MDHPLSAPDALVRPWRNAAYIAVAVAAVELLLLCLIGGGKLVGWASDRVQLAAQKHALAPVKQGPKSMARKPAPTPVAKHARSKTVVLVLNGNGRTGAAASAASRVHSRGYKIGTVTNAPELVPRSIVMYRPGFGMRAKDLGRAQVVFILGP